MSLGMFTKVVGILKKCMEKVDATGFDEVVVEKEVEKPGTSAPEPEKAPPGSGEPKGDGEKSGEVPDAAPSETGKTQKDL